MKACSLCCTVVKLNPNVMTQRHSDDLAGFRAKAQVSLWQAAHISVLICFCDRCKYVEMLSQPQRLPSSLMGVTHRWPHNRDVIKTQSYPTREPTLLSVRLVVEATLLALWVHLDREMRNRRGTPKTAGQIGIHKSRTPISGQPTACVRVLMLSNVASNVAFPGVVSSQWRAQCGTSQQQVRCKRWETVHWESFRCQKSKQQTGLT